MSAPDSIPVLRYFIELSYVGTAYGGWQVQQNADSVQARLNTALSTALGRETETTGSSRTDAGVHARHQTAHFDCGPVADTALLRYRLNALLPPDIAVLDLYPVKPETHCRFAALFRRYEYHIIVRKNPFLRGLAAYIPNKQGEALNLEAMQQAADLLLKYSDFQSFSKVHTDVSNFNCTVTEARWQQYPDGRLVFTIQANRFLRGMVRAIVGTLLNVGKGKLTLPEFEAVLKGKNRSLAGWSVPAEGLFLTQVGYPEGLRLTEAELNGTSY